MFIEGTIVFALSDIGFKGLPLKTNVLVVSSILSTPQPTPPQPHYLYLLLVGIVVPPDMLLALVSHI